VRARTPDGTPAMACRFLFGRTRGLHADSSGDLLMSWHVSWTPAYPVLGAPCPASAAESADSSDSARWAYVCAEYART
jgi:hypothetical protein